MASSAFGFGAAVSCHAEEGVGSGLLRAYLSAAMDNDAVYDVCDVSGSEPRFIRRFRSLEGAKEYTARHCDELELDIRLPNGEWYRRKDTTPKTHDDYPELRAYLAQRPSKKDGGGSS